MRQSFEAINEIQVRMEVIMETYQQVDQECDRLEDQSTFNQHVDIQESKKQELKDLVSLQYQEWHELLAQSE